MSLHQYSPARNHIKIKLAGRRPTRLQVNTGTTTAQISRHRIHPTDRYRTPVPTRNSIFIVRRASHVRRGSPPQNGTTDATIQDLKQKFFKKCIFRITRKTHTKKKLFTTSGLDETHRPHIPVIITLRAAIIKMKYTECPR